MKTPSLLVVIAIALCAPAHAALPGGEALGKLMLKQFDTNSDSTVDAGEWDSGNEESFKHMDENSDGALTEAELDALKGPITEEVGELSAVVVVPLVKKLVMLLDSDSDGKVGRDEYLKTISGLFKKLDTDANGSLSLAELSELPTKAVGG